MKKLILSLLLLNATLFACATCQLMTPTAEIKLELKTEDKKLEKIHTIWTFSDIYVNSLLVQYDTDRDEQLNAKEMDEVKMAMLDYLLQYDLLTQVRFAKDANADEAVVLKPTFSNFSLQLKDGLLYFDYDIELNILLQNNSQLSLVFNDDNGFFGFVVTDFLMDSQLFDVEQNLYLFTASIVFKEKKLQEPTQDKTPKEIQQTTQKEKALQAEQTPSLQANLLQTSIEKVQSLFESIKDEKNPLTYITLLIFAYIYGFIHALGPGHGKTLVASYFLSNERSYSKALFVSLAIGVVHTFSAFILTLIIYFGVNTFLSQFIQDSVYLTTKISALIIICIALYLIYKKYKAYKKLQNVQKFSFSEKPHVDTCACASCKVDTNSTDAALIISAGIIPCPGTTTIFIFAISLGLYYAGFLAALVMSLGMSSVIYVSALISVSVRKKTSQKHEKLKKYLEYASLSIILVLGVLLLLT